MLLALLLGCPPADAPKADTADSADSGIVPDTDAPCDPGTECCHDSLPWLALCVDGLGPDEALVGTFATWGAADTARFVTTAGDEVSVWVSQSDGAYTALPDLSAVGEVTLTQTGDCAGDAATQAAVHVAGPSGDTLLLTGMISIDGFAGWSVAADRDTTACPGLATPDGCWEFTHERPVAVTRGGTTATFHEGQEAAFGEGYTVRVSYASSGSGELSCDDASMDATAYWIVGP